jgi:Recombinational DNA repair ATPase (RecF pathway)
MIVNSLKLINFRNYLKADVSFKKGINFIYGDNASGKTSLVEGIYFLSLARSFRTSEDKKFN